VLQDLLHFSQSSTRKTADRTRVSHYARSTRVEPSQTPCRCCTLRRDVFISRVAVRGEAGIRDLYFPLSLSSFYARSPVALVNIFFARALAKRNDSRRAARERARTVTYGHARSLTHSRGPIHMPYIKAHPETGVKKGLASLLLRTNFRQ